jgi:hypothetical protein
MFTRRIPALPSRASLMKRATLAICLILVSVLTYTRPAPAQLTQSDIDLAPKVCPLSDRQTQNAIAAYAKMVPTFTKQPRCFNCHGGVDPFSDDGTHGGGPIARSDEDKCDTCHSNVPAPTGPTSSRARLGWRLPNLPDHSFVNRGATELCESMKQAQPTRALFVGHIENDNGDVDFNGVAFTGSRGLNEFGRALAFTQPFKLEPIEGITHDELVAQAKAWVDAMGGEMQGDKRCGCEPVHQAIEVSYDSKLQVQGGIGNVQAVRTMGPVKIPITFHDDRTFEGEGTLSSSGNLLDRGGRYFCVGQIQSNVKIKVSGDAIEEVGKNHMHIILTNITPEKGSIAEQCNAPFASGVHPMKSGSNASFSFDMKGLFTEPQVDQPVPLQGPVFATIHIKLVDLDEKPAPQK